MRKWFVIFSILVILLSPMRAQAQGEVTFSDMYVRLWPEYDAPGVLVIYNITLASDVALPAQVTLRLPANVEKMYVVAVGDTSANVTDQGVEYNLTSADNGSLLTINATGAAIQFEYYDSNLTINGTTRQFTYTWEGEYAVNKFGLEFQEPIGATNFSSDPALPNAVTADQFTVHSIESAGLKAGDKFMVGVRYDKADNTLSASQLQVQPSGGDLTSETSSGSPWVTYLPWGLAALGAILIVGGVIWYWQSGRSDAAPKSRRRHATRRVVEDDDDDGGDDIYCAQCGKRAKAGDRFCRTCGARIRHTE